MRKRGGSYLFLPASKALLLGISTGVFEQSKRARKWSESRALATIARARVPSGRPTSHLGDQHLVPHITLVRVASTSDGYRRLENARVERNKFVTRGAAAHVALVDCFR